MAVDAVGRNFEVIGEAARHVDAATAMRLADVPWQDMRDPRNLLIHEYFGISVAIIWETISRDWRSVREATGYEGLKNQSWAHGPTGPAWGHAALSFRNPFSDTR